MHPSHTVLTLSTPLGAFDIKLDTENAPVTAGYFGQLAADGLLNGTSIFRIVNSDNNQHNPACPIHVVQGGLMEDSGARLPAIAHETTEDTGLSHRKWAVSTARQGVGETYGSFFIVMRDEPSLDFGGARHPDGQGFAAFGEVISDFAVVEAIFAQAEDDEFLQQQIPIITATVDQLPERVGESSQTPPE